MSTSTDTPKAKILIVLKILVAVALVLILLVSGAVIGVQYTAFVKACKTLEAAHSIATQNEEFIDALTRFLRNQGVVIEGGGYGNGRNRPKRQQERVGPENVSGSDGGPDTDDGRPDSAGQVRPPRDEVDGSGVP